MEFICLQAFEEAELPRLKEEKPGLTHTQYKDMIWKLWKKSPDNPLNQVNFTDPLNNYIYDYFDRLIFGHTSEPLWHTKISVFSFSFSC